MAVRRTFGKTWWGNAWVEAMEKIDSNRLQRGRTYANNGSVREVEISDGVVLAKVKGSRPKPYNIKIGFKSFTASEIKKIKNITASNPAIAAELHMGRLPASLLSVLAYEKIDVFPASWRDISADCSCPDYANPCKHLAAVYYIIANEIDKDPFIIFALRGIPRLIETSGFPLDTAMPEKRKTGMFIPADRIKIDTEAEQVIDTPDIAFKSVDIDAVFSLLPASPLFYPAGDFKKILRSAYKTIIKEAEQTQITEDEACSFKGMDFHLVYDAGSAKKHLEFMFFITGEDTSLKKAEKYFPVRKTDVNMRVPEIIDGRLKFIPKTGIEVSTGSVFDAFLSLPLDTGLDTNSVSSRFLNLAASAALSLVKSGAFLPEPVEKEEGRFSIIYVPVIHDEKVKNADGLLKTLMPLTFCFKKDEDAVMEKDGPYDLLSMIITHIVHSSMRPKAKGVKSIISNKIEQVFFQDNIYAAERFEEKQTCKTVSGWLERVHLRQRDVSPVIRIGLIEGERFTVSIDVENKKNPITPLIPLSEVLNAAKTIFSYPAGAVKMDVLRQIIIAGEHMPLLLEILNGKGQQDKAMSGMELSGFMTRAANILNLLGIRVMLPVELSKMAVPRIAIKAEKKGGGSFLTLDGMLDFSWEVAIGDRTVSKAEFLKLAKNAKGVVRFHDQYVMLTPDEIKNIIDKLSRPVHEMTPMDMLHHSFAGEVDGVLFNPGEALKKVLAGITKVEDIKIPAGLNADLRPYQERGFRWLYSNTVKGFGSCIADDMGLGKTIQIITLLLKLKEDDKLKKPALVICPTTLIGNWNKECQRFAPSLCVSTYHGTERSLTVKDMDIVITTYGILRRDIKKFQTKEWGLVIIDEAQNIKNPDTAQTKAVKSIKAEGFIAMSGTPVENRLSELWSIFDFTNKGYLDKASRFQTRYAVPIEKYRSKEVIEKLKAATSPFLLRRLKSDKAIISDLPDKVMSDEYCYLSTEQAAIYQQVVDATMKIISGSEGIERRGLIFKLITSLKQICNHPVNYSKKGRPDKGLSGKSERTVELTGKILSMKEKALIFTQYKEMGDILVEMIRNEFEENALFFHGGIARTKRDKMVEGFQTDDAVRLMIVSLKAGGTGLNLTAASNVIHYDLWWNPAVEAQATDRAYRIGQDKNVMVHRLITLGTFEEKIDEMIKAKKELAELTVSTGEQWITELSDKELKNIFSLT